MNLALAAAGTSVRAAAAFSPRWGAAVAMPLFGHVAKPRPVHSDDEATLLRARLHAVRIAGIDRRGVDVDTYEWGDGPRTVVLSHGWNGRASQFSVLVRELLADGYRVVAFDAPAHGDSPGRSTYLIDWIDALAAVQRRHGRLRAVVGHSFGGLAALVAACDGLPVERVVTVASPADAGLLLTQFQRMLGYGDPVAAALRDRFARRYFPGVADPFPRLSPIERPVPAGTALLAVHDETDRVVPYGELGRIAGAHRDARLVTTHGFGHNRILESDPFLDAVIDFVGAPVPSSVTPPIAQPAVLA